MKPLPHRYSARIAGEAAGYATLSSDGVPDLPTAAPPDFDGPGDAWSPEQLLLAAVESCFLLTFRSVAQASRLEFVSLSVETEGVVDRVNGVPRFTEIVLRPRVVLPAGTTGRAFSARSKRPSGPVSSPRRSTPPSASNP
jgi:organic hydroperoxide reductase OsmC/OhrA